MVLEIKVALVTFLTFEIIGHFIKKNFTLQIKMSDYLLKPDSRISTWKFVCFFGHSVLQKIMDL